MKKLRLSTMFLALAIPAVMLSSCKKENENDGLASIGFTKTEISFAKDDAGADKAQTVTLNANRDWEITGVPEWVTVNPITSSGDQVITITPTDNSNGEYREAVITATLKNLLIKPATLTIKQAGKSGSVPGDVVTTFTEDFEAVVNNNVYSSAKWHFSSSATDWPATERYNGWHGRVFSNSTTGESEKYIACAPYNYSSTVTAYAVIASPFNVSGADDKTLKFDLAFYFKAYDDSKLELVSSTDYDGDAAAATWTIVDTYKFAEADKQNDWNTKSVDLTSYASQEKVFFAFRYVGKDVTYRLDNVRFNAGDITPTPSFGVNPTTMGVPADGGDVTVNVTGNSAWTAEIIEGDTYVTSFTESGTTAGPIKVTFTKNESTEETRTVKMTVSTTADVDVKDYTVVFTQAKQSTGGGGLPAGTVIFKETWGTFAEQSEGVALADYDNGGTTLHDMDDVANLVYTGGQHVALYHYTSGNGAVAVSSGYTGASGGAQILFPKNSRAQTTELGNIPLYEATAVQLTAAWRYDATACKVTYVFNDSASTTGVFAATGNAEVGDNSWQNHTFTPVDVPAGATTIKMIFETTSNYNLRADDIVLTAK